MSLNPGTSTRTSWLLRLYPAAWRARYAEEFTALLDDYPLTFWGLLDILLGALDAYIAPLDTTGRILRMIQRPRRTAIVVFCAYIAFVLAGMSYQQSIEDDLRTLNGPHPDISLAYHIVLVVAPLSLLAVLAGGAPIGLLAAFRALRNRRWDVLALFAVPPLALAIWLGWTLIIARVIMPSQAPASIRQPISVGLFLSWGGLFVLAAIVSTAAVSIAVSRSDVSPTLYRFALGPAVAATVAMLVMLGAVVAWGLLVRANLPGYMAHWSTPIRWPETVNWLAQVIVMATATLVAAIALLRAYRSPTEPASVAAAAAA
jgi:hypothetical protein